jgi:DNA polymerase-3 subunit gamma/tau
VHTLPYESERKVYIIDEVHMLTKEAFNALLKTLEEPPSHVVFILATTEEEKLLDTIRSRCQTFRFRAPSREALAKTVTDVAKREGFALAKAAADLIAIAADGSFRDALGITQKVILASGNDKNDLGGADEVAALIGAPKHALLRELVDAFAEKDAEKGIGAIKAARAEHVEMKLFVRLLLERVRAVMLARNVPAHTDEYLEVFGEDDAKHLKALAEAKGSTLTSHLLLRLLDVAAETNWSQIPELPLEIAIIELCKKEQ